MTRAHPCPHQPWNLYEINTRLWLPELGVASLREVPDVVLSEYRAMGFDMLWLMGVWSPSAAATRVALSHPELHKELQAANPALTPGDIGASPYAVGDYELAPMLGERGDLAALRERMHGHGLRLILDFVPNHTGLDHPFVVQHPERYVAPRDPGALAPDLDLDGVSQMVHGTRVPESFRAPCGRRLMLGRDPHFAPWIDTAQLDYRRRDTRAAMIGELLRIAARCDGVRCDMAMLVLTDVFEHTWGRRAAPVPEEQRAAGEFWSEAIDRVKAAHPGFLFIAEAYWGLERRLQHLGFDYTYDKSLYDHLVHGNAAAVNHHLAQGHGRHRRALRFLENHDEPRAAAALAERERHQVAALITLTLPGVRLLHHGQLEGTRRRAPVQLLRRAEEPVDEALRVFYQRLLSALQDPVLRYGAWRFLAAAPAWEGNPSHQSMVVYGWDGSLLGSGSDGSHRLLVANLAGHRAQCRVRLPLPGLGGRTVLVEELLAAGHTPEVEVVSEDGVRHYRRSGEELALAGLYLDLPAHSAQLFRLRPQPRQ